MVPARVGGTEKAAAADLLGWLRSADTQSTLDRYGLRRADGTAGDRLSEDRGVDRRRIEPLPARTPDGYAGAQAAWTLITRPTSTLTVLDVAGSMAEPVPGTTRTKLDLARAAGIASLEFAAPGDSIGLWEFSTRLAPGRDFRALVPLGPVRQQVGRFPKTRNYRADAVNTVIVISDGINDDPGSLALPALLTRLQQQFDPRRPVHLMTLAYGAQADRRALAQIAGATRGLAFTAVDERRLSDVFIAAVTAYRLKG